jgi:hypothetical protein
MDQKRLERDAFLEAHYYSSGLRYRHISDQGDRPDWAPPPDEVGFRNDIPLTSGDIVIEFQRRVYNQKRITWLGVYEWAVDKRLGDRENHSGVGVWLREGVIVSPYSTINYLTKILFAYRDNLDHPSLDKEATALLKDVIIQSIRRLDDFSPGFAGSPFSEYPILNSGFYHIHDDFCPPSIQLAADQISLISFLPKYELPARTLIVISPEQKIPRSGDSNIINLGIVKKGISELIDHIPDGISIERQAVSRIIRKLESSEANLKSEILNRRKLEGQIDQLKKDKYDISSVSPFSGRIDDIFREISHIKEIVNQLDRRLSHREKTIHPVTDDDPNDQSDVHSVIMKISLFILSTFALGGVIFIGYLIYNNFIR